MPCRAVLKKYKTCTCFYRVIETRVKVWENEKCCGNSSYRQVLPQLFRVLPNVYECFYNLIETRWTCFLFLKDHDAKKENKLVHLYHQNAYAIITSTTRASSVFVSSYWKHGFKPISARICFGLFSNVLYCTVNKFIIIIIRVLKYKHYQSDLRIICDWSGPWLSSLHSYSTQHCLLFYFEQSGFESWLGTSYCVRGQDSQCLSPLTWIKRYWRIQCWE